MMLSAITRSGQMLRVTVLDQSRNSTKRKETAMAAIMKVFEERKWVVETETKTVTLTTIHDNDPPCARMSSR